MSDLIIFPMEIMPGFERRSQLSSVQAVRTLFSKAMGSTKEILASVAAEKGADAVVGVRYHFVGKEIVSVGTAVKLLN